MEELRVQAEKLAEERRRAREQALEWTRDIKMESDEERERKAKKASRRVKTEGGSGDEAGEPKKKRRGKLKKTNGAVDGEDAAALFSGDEEGEKPARKVRGCFCVFHLGCLPWHTQRSTKKRVVRDDDDDEEALGNPRKKQM